MVTVVTVVVFVVVVLIVKLKAWGPLMAALDEREANIRNSLEAAERAAAKAEDAAKANLKLVEEARVEAKEIVAEGKRDAVALAARIEEEAKAATADIKSRVIVDIERAKLIAVHEIHQRAVHLSIGISEALIQESLSADEHQGLIDDAIQSYEKMS